MYIDEQNPHGGDIYTHRGCLDFSANINPFGMPAAVRAAAESAVAQSVAYPDPACRALAEKLALYEGVPRRMILCGNGAAELIYAFAYALPKEKPVLLICPAFCEYAAACSAADLPLAQYFLKRENGFRADADLLSADFAAYGAVMLASPNNPTGVSIDLSLLEEMAKRGVRLFCDMCFDDLTDTPRREEVSRLLLRYPNLVVLKAFTKSFAMPGLRLGYAMCADGEFLCRMSQKTQGWNVSLPAQAAGVAALSCGDWLCDTVRVISAERRRIAESLRAMGLAVYASETDFLLVYAKCDLYSRLLARGILVRDCANYPGLGKGFYRIAVRLPGENDRLLSTMKEVLS